MEWNLNKMAAVVQTTFSDAFSSMKIVVFSSFDGVKPEQNGHRLADDIFRFIFFNENCCIFIIWWSEISLKITPKGPIDNRPSLVQIMDWRRLGDKPLSELKMALCTDVWSEAWTRWLWDRFVYAAIQWEAMLHCSTVSHWLGGYTKWSLWLVCFRCDFGISYGSNGALSICLARSVDDGYILLGPVRSLSVND